MLIPVLIIGGVGLVLAVGLGIASRRLAVENTELIERIVAVLPGTNCGVCGYAACSRYARAVAAGTAGEKLCVPGGAQVAVQLAEFMSLAAAPREPVYAVVRCQGGRDQARPLVRYEGVEDCFAAHALGKGPSVCREACLGLGTCVHTCPRGAISIRDNGVAWVDAERCNGCGDCLESCPRALIALVPSLHKIYLACANRDSGPGVAEYCSVGCTACGVCARLSAPGAVSMKYNLPVLDYANGDNFVVAAHRCPQRSFVDLVKARPKANIDSKCDGCGACREHCPVDAIRGENGSRHEIDKAGCVGCGICLDKCHARAIALWGSLGFGAWDRAQRRRFRG